MSTPSAFRYVSPLASRQPSSMAVTPLTQIGPHPFRDVDRGATLISQTTASGSLCARKRLTDDCLSRISCNGETVPTLPTDEISPGEIPPDEIQLSFCAHQKSDSEAHFRVRCALVHTGHQLSACTRKRLLFFFIADSRVHLRFILPAHSTSVKWRGSGVQATFCPVSRIAPWD